MLNNIMSKINKKVIVLLVVIAFSIVGYLVYTSSLFSISSISPNNKRFPNSLNRVSIVFNKPISVNEITDRYSKDPNSVFSTNIPGKNTLKVTENSLEIMFEKTPASGTFELSLISITSLNGGKIINKSLSFEFVDIPYTELSDAEKIAYDEFSSIAEEPPESQKKVDLLPYQTNDYLIQYLYPPEDSDEDTGIILITMKFFPETIASQELTEEQSSEYFSMLRKHRGDAINWLESNGFNLDEFSLEYSEPELVDEFPSGKLEHGDDL